MTYHDKCACCGHQTSAYTFPFNRGLARSFLKFADAAIRAAGPVAPGDLGMTNSEYSNFPKLRYFGLIQQEARGAGWYFTDRGLRFLAGEITVLSPVALFANEILPDDHLAWATHPGKRTAVRMADILPAEWKQYQEYRAEKSARSA